MKNLILPAIKRADEQERRAEDAAFLLWNLAVLVMCFAFVILGVQS